MRVLATFDVKDVNCSKDADKANIHAAGSHFGTIIDSPYCFCKGTKSSIDFATSKVTLNPQPSTRKTTQAAIIRWYGSLEAFSEFVSGPFRQKVRDLTRTPGRMPLECIQVGGTLLGVQFLGLLYLGVHIDVPLFREVP